MKLPSLSIVSCLCLAFATLFLAGCGGGRSYSLSAKAKQAERLIDAGSFEAAHNFFLNELSQSAGDAGLHCQYTRFLIASRDPAYPNFIQSPLHPDYSHYWAEGVAQRAATIAHQLDPDCAGYLATLILETFAERMEASLAEKRGCIGHGQFLYTPETGRSRYFPGSQLSMISICWKSLELAPDIASTFADRFDRLTEDFAKLGKVATAPMLGNLAGDLRQKGEGDKDFQSANRALIAALRNYEPDGQTDWVDEIAKSYPHCFRDELLAIQRGAEPDESFKLVVAELEARGIAIPKVEEKEEREVSFPTGGPPV